MSSLQFRNTNFESSHIDKGRIDVRKTSQAKLSMCSGVIQYMISVSEVQLNMNMACG